MQPQDFYTATKSSRGARFDLVDGAGGREWVRVRSVLSSEFVAMAMVVSRQAESYADLMKTAAPEEQKRLKRNRRALLAASLVADWSLPMKSLEEIRDLLIVNPRLRRQIERISEAHHLHFGTAA